MILSQMMFGQANRNVKEDADEEEEEYDWKRYKCKREMEQQRTAKER